MLDDQLGVFQNQRSGADGDPVRKYERPDKPGPDSSKDRDHATLHGTPSDIGQILDASNLNIPEIRNVVHMLIGVHCAPGDVDLHGREAVVQLPCPLQQCCALLLQPLWVAHP